ncbi:Neuron navigator 2 like protein [Argiope bruennichi]|uniref:Neuron navigator 2 like protein n=1 Tax=Argiope bruennichi TaxID=94029 RepID=A0A8T0EXK9_ARGBR|nr:Neuron navigator 2 like protein [Argiope bruennichi]
MAYLKHSFTLPSSLRKSKRNKAKIDLPPLASLPGSPGLSRSETTLYVKTEEDGRSSAFIPLDNIEATLSRRRSNYVPDFYGGHPLPEYSPQSDDHSDYGSDSMAHSEVESILTDTGSTSVTLSSSSSTCDTSSEVDVKNETSGQSDNLSSPEANTVASDWQFTNNLTCDYCPVGLCNCTTPQLYRMRLPCCQTMEPLWESSPVGDTSTYGTRKKVVNWYDRKLKRKSCPVLQAHMVAAFEQSLSNMTSRLQHLTASAEQKDCELMELRNTIEALKQQSAEAGLTKMALQSMQAVQRTLQEHRISRQFSTDSMSSVNSCSSACSGNSGKSGDALSDKKKKKKGWLRNSFSKAFSRSKKNKNGSVSDVEDLRHLQSDSSTPNSPLLGAGHTTNGNGHGLKQSHSSSALYEKEDEDTPEAVKDLKKQLHEKDMMLTDIRLDALSSAHQLENLKETVNKMRSEMLSLKQDNDRLQRLVATKSLTSSHSSLPLRNSSESLEKRLSASEHSGPPSIAEMYLNEPRNDQDGKLVNVSVYLGCHGDSSMFQKQNANISEVLIGNISISSKTKWDLLDNLVKRSFKEYVLRVDPVSNLGLNAESIVNYHVGEIVRAKDADAPELLPCGYVVGDNMHIRLVLKGTKQHSVDALAFESLIPKSIVQRYISLLTEHRRIILCGPSGTGKTYIAQKLAEYLVLKNGKELAAGAIATFSVDHKSAKELRQYLSNVAEQCETSNVSDLPTVIILDNLHHVGSLGEVFNGFLSAKYQKCPYIIGTMNQATCSTTNLQLHHNFRWVLCANHMEPVKSFLGRYLKRKLVEEEVKGGIRNAEIAKVIDWMPKVWHHLNKYLETHNSSDVTIGPRLFLSCPIDLSSSQVWFTDLWNYSIVPYVLEAVREGLQLYGRRAPWEDPAEWVYETYPWPIHQSTGEPQLLRLRPEDVGYEGHPGPSIGSKNQHTNNPNNEADPLLNMLMRLQEAASYSSPHSNDSDTTSMDSHGSSLHSDELMGSGLESTLLQYFRNSSSD